MRFWRHFSVFSLIFASVAGAASARAEGTNVDCAIKYEHHGQTVQAKVELRNPMELWVRSARKEFLNTHVKVFVNGKQLTRKSGFTGDFEELGDVMNVWAESAELRYYFLNVWAVAPDAPALAVIALKPKEVKLGAVSCKKLD